jgi:hypothetical protein
VTSENFTISYIGNWPSAAKTALQYAVDLWSVYLKLPQPLKINAVWNDTLKPSTLANCGATIFYQVIPDPFYRQVALAEAMKDSNYNGLNAELNMNVNANRTDWYWGTDGDPGSSETDFVSVALHEICHGLGFAGSMDTAYINNDNVGKYWSPPIIYDKYTYDISSRRLIDLPNNSHHPLLDVLLTGVWFSGPNEQIGHSWDGLGFDAANLHTPNPWVDGSSYNHLSDSYNDSPADLMTHSIGTNHAVHQPGRTIRGIFQDLGWVTFQPEIYNPLRYMLGLMRDPFGIRLLPGSTISPVTTGIDPIRIVVTP